MTGARRTGKSAADPTRDDEAIDPGRRSFFRTFGRQAIHTAASVAGAADALRRGTTAAGAELLGLGLGTAGAVDRLARGARSSGAAAAPGELEVGFHSPYRIEGDALVILDQRRLPSAAVELRCRGGYEIAAAIRDYAVEGAPLLAQLAAYGMALTAHQWREASPEECDGRMRVAAAALRNARLAPVSLETTVERMEQRRRSLGDAATGHVTADVLRAEADALASQATLDHARLGRFGAERLRLPGGPALALLTHGSVGALAGGSVGTALAVVQALIADGHQVDVWVTESRPALSGSRLTAWELAQASISYRIAADAAMGVLLESGRVDAVLVGAERIAANGDTLNTIGTYPLAVLAARHGIPVYVCAPIGSADLGAPDGAQLPEETRPAGELTALGGTSVTPTGASIFNPGVDVTPAELITAFITDQGVLDQPFGAQLAAAVAAASRGHADVAAPALH